MPINVNKLPRHVADIAMPTIINGSMAMEMLATRYIAALDEQDELDKQIVTLTARFEALSIEREKLLSGMSMLNFAFRQKCLA